MNKFECISGKSPKEDNIMGYSAIDPDVVIPKKNSNNMRTMSWTVMYNWLNEQVISISSERGGAIGLQVMLPDGSMKFCRQVIFDAAYDRVVIYASSERSEKTIGALVKGLSPREPIPFAVGDVPVIIRTRDIYESPVYRTAGGVIGTVKPGLLFWRGTDILMRAGSVLTSPNAPVDIVYDKGQVS